MLKNSGASTGKCVSMLWSQQPLHYVIVCYMCAFYSNIK